MLFITSMFCALVLYCTACQGTNLFVLFHVPLVLIFEGKSISLESTVTEIICQMLCELKRVLTLVLGLQGIRTE